MDSKPGKELAREHEVATPVIVGAALAAGTALLVIARRPRSDRWRAPPRPGVVSTLFRGALVGALKTVPRLVLIGLLEKLLRSERGLVA